jgi:hypothetical protein
MSKYDYAISAAKDYADYETVKSSGTDNPFGGVIKNRIKNYKNPFVKLFKIFDRTLINFMIYEYTTFRIGLNALVGNGYMTRLQGAKMAAAVFSRAMMYVFIASITRQLFANLIFGPDDDEEQNLTKGLGRAFLNAFVSLIFGGNMGNFIRGIESVPVEGINERHMDFLREGDYDMYKNAISYSFIPLENAAYGRDKTWETVKNMTGAYSPAIKATSQAVSTFVKTPKKPDAIERQKNEMMVRTPIEIMGSLGFIPLYTDVRRIMIRWLYKDMPKIGKKIELSDEQVKELYPLQYEEYMRAKKASEK